MKLYREFLLNVIILVVNVTRYIICDSVSLFSFSCFSPLSCGTWSFFPVEHSVVDPGLLTPQALQLEGGMISILTLASRELFASHPQKKLPSKNDGIELKQLGIFTYI